MRSSALTRPRTVVSADALTRVLASIMQEATALL